MKGFLAGLTITLAIAGLLYWYLFGQYVPDNYIPRTEAAALAEQNDAYQHDIDELREQYRELYNRSGALERSKRELEHELALARNQPQPPSETRTVSRPDPQQIQQAVDSALARLDVHVGRQGVFEFYQMPVGDAWLPPEEFQRLLEQVSPRTQPGVLYLIVGISDEKPFAGTHPELKQQGLAVRRAKHLETLLESEYGARSDLVFDILTGRADQRGVLVTRIEFEPQTAEQP